MMTIGPITFDQHWHHILYTTSAGIKVLSIDTQIRMIGLMEPEICTNNAQKFISNKPEQNFQ